MELYDSPPIFMVVTDEYLLRTIMKSSQAVRTFHINIPLYYEKIVSTGLA